VTVGLLNERIVDAAPPPNEVLRPPSLPEDRVERSDQGIWTDCALRELTDRDESLLDDERDGPDDTLRDEDAPLLFDERLPSERTFLSS
jgi:hypothetical protein